MSHPYLDTGPPAGTFSDPDFRPYGVRVALPVLPNDGGYPLDSDLHQMSDDGGPAGPDPARWADADWRDNLGESDTFDAVPAEDADAGARPWEGMARQQVVAAHRTARRGGEFRYYGSRR